MVAGQIIGPAGAKKTSWVLAREGEEEGDHTTSLIANCMVFLCFVFVFVSKKKKRGGEVGGSDLESKITLNMPDFPIKKKGFQSLCAPGIQK